MNTLSFLDMFDRVKPYTRVMVSNKCHVYNMIQYCIKQYDTSTMVFKQAQLIIFVT